VTDVLPIIGLTGVGSLLGSFVGVNYGPQDMGFGGSIGGTSALFLGMCFGIDDLRHLY